MASGLWQFAMAAIVAISVPVFRYRDQPDAQPVLTNFTTGEPQVRGPAKPLTNSVLLRTDRPNSGSNAGTHDPGTPLCPRGSVAGPLDGTMERIYEDTTVW